MVHFITRLLRMTLVTACFVPAVAQHPKTTAPRSHAGDRGGEAATTAVSSVCSRNAEFRRQHSRDMWARVPHTSLMRAAAQGRLNGVRILLRRGAAVNEKNELGMTALMLAAAAGHVDVVKALLAAGADPNASAGIAHVGAWSVLTMAMNPLNRNWLEVIDALIAAGGKVNPPRSVTISPLVYAVEQCDTRMIKALLARGADVNWDNEISRAPLVSTVTNGEPDVEVTRLLLEAGADPNKPRLSVGNECVSILVYLDGWLEASSDKDREEIRRLLERSGARRHREKTKGRPCHP